MCAGHSGHFYNCQNGHTFVITEVRSNRMLLAQAQSIVIVHSAGEPWKQPDAPSAKLLLEARPTISTHPTRATGNSKRLQGGKVLLRAPGLGVETCRPVAN
jgi:hypothetical protein